MHSVNAHKGERGVGRMEQYIKMSIVIDKFVFLGGSSVGSFKDNILILG